VSLASFSAAVPASHPVRALVVAGFAAAFFGPAVEGQDLITRAERTGFVETSSYADVVAFTRAAADADPRMHYTTFGYTSEGRPLPLIVVGDVADGRPETVRASGKTVVYLQGNIHAGEVCGKEALQMLLADMVEGRHSEWLATTVLLVAPIYNADGNERVTLTNRGRQHGPLGGMGQRPNAQGYDLNRDHMKLDSPEARSVARLFNEYDPHVALDLHTTNGTTHAYHVTYSTPLHPNTPAAIDDLLRNRLLPHLTDEVRQKYGWEYYYYGNAGGFGGSEPAWRTFDHRPRFNNNYIGLRNRIALLSEAYSYATFEDRVMSTLYFVEETLDYVHENAAAVRAIVAAADESVVGETLALRAIPKRSAEPVDILMGEVDEEQHPLTGATILRRRDVSRVETMYEYGTFEASETGVVPRGYIVPAELGEIVTRLRAHGLAMEAASTTAIEVEAFRVDSVSTAERAFQGHNEQEVFGAYEGRTVTPSEGAFWVSADQPLGRLLFMLLEPRSDDGFANWGLLADELSPGATYPVLRVPAADR
jgi:hypothetical protein